MNSITIKYIYNRSTENDSNMILVIRGKCTFYLILPDLGLFFSTCSKPILLPHLSSLYCYAQSVASWHVAFKHNQKESMRLILFPTIVADSQYKIKYGGIVSNSPKLHFWHVHTVMYMLTCICYYVIFRSCYTLRNMLQLRVFLLSHMESSTNQNRNYFCMQVLKIHYRVKGWKNE